ncbi:MAG: type ISP restriction/modification enzyme [Caldisericia bacterium]
MRMEQYDLGQARYANNDFEEISFKVDKMKLNKDKTELIYNRDITLKGIPPEVFEYKLGNRSALEWIIDQYRVKTDKRSGITQDPNNFDGNEYYIFELIGKIVTVSLETVKLVEQLSKLAYK